MSTNGYRRETLPPRGEGSLFLELGRILSFLLSILSLLLVVSSAFFEPGTRLQDRLVMALAKIGVAGCVCFASGLFFCRPPAGADPGEALVDTMPVRMFFWTVAGVAILFLLSWYLEVYFVPLMWRNQPHEIGEMLLQLGRDSAILKMV